MIITLFGWFLWQYSEPINVSSAEASFSFLTKVFGIGLTILVIDGIRYSEEQRRWKNVNDIVKKTFLNSI
jgi:hypothetical protein